MELTGRSGSGDKMLFWAVIGIGGIWLIYQLLSKVSGVASAATQAATTALANWYVKLTSSGQAIPQGVALLPDGVTSVPLASVSVTSVPNTASPAGISGYFQYNGTGYYLNSAHDSNGNYAASTTLGYP